MSILLVVMEIKLVFSFHNLLSVIPILDALPVLSFYFPVGLAEIILPFIVIHI